MDEPQRAVSASACAALFWLQSDLQECSNRFCQSSRVVCLRDGERQAPRQTVPLHPQSVEKVRPPDGMLWKNRIAEARLHQALDRFRVFRLHHHVGHQIELPKKLIDNEANVAAGGIQKERNTGKLGGLD